MKVVDANVLIHGTGLSGQYVTVPQVREEVKSRKGEQGWISVKPEVKRPSNVEEASRKAEEINADVSRVDVALAALAVDLGVPLLTDDRELQNLVMHLGGEVEGFLDDAVKEKRRWEMVCEACGSRSCSCGAGKERRRVR